jgi:hypothetical protein
VVYPVFLALVIDASLKHRSGQLVLGVAGLAVLYTVTWALGTFSSTGRPSRTSVRTCQAASGSGSPSRAE